MASAGRVMALRIVQVTTVAARQMQSLPIPAPRPAERIMLSAAASQLRAMAEMADLGGPALVTSETAEIEGALAKLIEETLALVDKVLATNPELAGPSRRELPATSSGSEPPPPTKVSF